jgi:hypothetical protein
MKDLERNGSKESAQEDLDDMMSQASQNTEQLQALMQFFKEMFHIAIPYTDTKTKKIAVPKNGLPIEKLTTGLSQKINTIDPSFVETMAYAQWIEIFAEGYQKTKAKLEQSQSFSHKLK